MRGDVVKTTFKISPRFPVRIKLAKEIAMFCIRLAKPVALYRGLLVPERVDFTMFGSKYKTRSGRAKLNCNRNLTAKTTVFVRLGPGYGFHAERYQRYADSPLCWCDGTVETYVHLVAHELGHAICGFDGLKVGEFQCERFAEQCLDAWRNSTQDPAAMI